MQFSTLLGPVIAMLVVGGLHPLVSAAQDNDAARQANNIAALLTALESSSEDKRAQATLELTKIGKPAAAALVKALSDPSQAKRILAATALRELLQRNPKARPNDHGELYWQANAAKIKIGMRRADVYRLLLPNPPHKPGVPPLEASIGTGRTIIDWYRLDDYWSVSVNYHLPDTVSVLPLLKKNVKQIWVAPPKKFTGEWNGWYVNGRKARCVHYKNGKYHGVFAMYYGNGRMTFQQNYKDGVITGDEAGWHPNGKKSYTGQYDKNGKREGKWTHWFHTGKMQTRTEFLAGKNHGLSEWWHPNGQLRYQDHYQNGVKHGVSRAFDLGGAVLWERLYRNGEIAESP